MIWRIPHSQRTVRMAEGLIGEAQAARLEGRRAAVHRIASMDPRRVTDLVLALAELAARSLQPPLPTDDQVVINACRAAHNAYNQGLRLDWVIDGERQYQREKKRRARQLQLEIEADREQHESSRRRARAG